MNKIYLYDDYCYIIFNSSRTSNNTQKIKLEQIEKGLNGAKYLECANTRKQGPPELIIANTIFYAEGVFAEWVSLKK